MMNYPTHWHSEQAFLDESRAVMLSDIYSQSDFPLYISLIILEEIKELSLREAIT